MPRILTYLIALLVLVLVVGLASWYLAYNVADEPPAEIALAGLNEVATITWMDGPNAAIEAASWPDAVRALGYAQGTRQTWQVLLLRQTALGRLSTWFGPSVADLDRFARTLLFAAQARTTYEQLDTDAQQRLQAYADGLNAAFASPQVSFHSDLVLLDLSPPSRWEPWHALAVERLVAWLATPPPILPDSLQHTPVAAFWQADDALRDWLHLHSFSNSMAWTVANDTARVFYQRQVYGSTIPPLFFNAHLRLPDAQTYLAALPGFPGFPAGATDAHAWSLLLSSSASIRPPLAVPDAATITYERIELGNGSEELVEVVRHDSTLFLAGGTPNPDTSWALTWRGLLPGTDLRAWEQMQAGAPPTFRLLRGDGLLLQRDGTWRVLGAPRVAQPIPGGMLVSNDIWSRYVAAHLDSLLTSTPLHAFDTMWQTDVYSRWAAAVAPVLIAQLSYRPIPVGPAEEALTYLHNWDYAYDVASIAATIFEAWMQNYRTTTGQLATAADTTLSDMVLLHRAFIHAVDQLHTSFGPDLNQWRWERTAPRARYFPVWSAQAERDLHVPTIVGERFDSLMPPASGHPSTLAWGPSQLQADRPSPSIWEAWLTSATWPAWTTRQYHLDPHAFLSRALRVDDALTPQSFEALQAEGTTRLMPAAP